MYAYSDPVTELVESLCIQFEFDTAHKKLQECEKVWHIHQNAMVTAVKKLTSQHYAHHTLCTGAGE